MIRELRMKKGLTQEELAAVLSVSRTAISKWESGETTPNTETLKLLSKLFDVSINTLLGSPRQLICQCCGMPLEDASISKSRTVSLTKNTAGGVMRAENICIMIWMT